MSAQLAALTLLPSALFAGGDPIVLPGDRAISIVADGRTDYQIICDQDALPATLFAATELQRFIEESTGVRLRIIAPYRRGSHSILLQRDVTLPRDGYSIRVKSGDVVIRGHDTPGDPRTIDWEDPVSTGTLYGVYELLEQRLGIRFYWPDALGIIVPRHASLALPADWNTKGAPHFTLRRLRYGPGFVDLRHEASTGVWGRRLRLGASQPTRFYHNWHRVLNVEEWAASGHPEYAALVDGERRTSYVGGRRQGEVCTANPEVLELFVRAARGSSDRMFSVSPNDGFGVFCECATCQALDSGRQIPDGKFAGRRDLSDRIVSFYNRIAERANRAVGGYAYNEYLEVPARTKLHPLVTISVVLNDAWLCGDPTEQRRAERLLKAWGEYAPRSSLYDILYMTGGVRRSMRELIAPLGVDAERRVRLVAESGLSGAQLYIAPAMELTGADTYVISRMLWDPRVDPRGLRREYYRDLYGPSARFVEELYDVAEQGWREAVRTRPVWQWRPTMIGLVPRLEELLERAVRAAGEDSRVRRRLERLRNVVERMGSLSS
jgi:hypothetical protein